MNNDVDTFKAARWLASMVVPQYSVGPATTAITDTYAGVGLALTGAASVIVSSDPFIALAIPDRNALLQSLQAAFTGGAGGVTQVTWFLSLEQNGDQAITPEITTPIVFRPGSTAIGTAVASIRDGGLPFLRTRDSGTAGTALYGTSGTIYLHVKSAQAGGSFALEYPKLYWTHSSLPELSTTPRA